jgi:hypothetical protein
MNPNPAPTPGTSKNRQVLYAVGILIIFVVMYPFREWLDGLKTRKQLGEATLGQVDTGSFVLKLLMIGGFRGMAANVLWSQAIELQKVHEWDRLKQKVDMITRLQPHFLSIWTFQGWNLAYNVSVEWDAPEDKYDWIKKGIIFLKDGVEKNRTSPDLVWDVAWTYYHKYGFADEAIVLRKLFRDDEDEEFKKDPIDGNVKHDNFQLGGAWFKRAVRLVDEGARRLAEGQGKDVDADFVDKPTQHKGRPEDLAFRSMPAHSQTRYAAGLEKQSIRDVPATFGPVAREEWRKALDEWLEFGAYRWPAWSKRTEMVQLDDLTEYERFKKLSPDQKYWTDRWSTQMNYPYWKARCQAEMTKEGSDARQLFHEATIAFQQANFLLAVGKYRDGLEIWDKLLQRFPVYRKDDMNEKDTGLVLKRYFRALEQAGLPRPKDVPFPELHKLVDLDYSPDPFDDLEMSRARRNQGRDQGQGQGQPVPRAPR